MTQDNADFIAKLRQIEELANVVNAELPHSSLTLSTRVQHILVLARALRGRLEFGAVAIVRIDPQATSPGELEKPPA